MNHRYGREEINLLLLAAKILKQYCFDNRCENCIFGEKEKNWFNCCLQDELPESWCLPNGERED